MASALRRWPTIGIRPVDQRMVGRGSDDQVSLVRKPAAAVLATTHQPGPGRSVDATSTGSQPVSAVGAGRAQRPTPTAIGRGMGRSGRCLAGLFQSPIRPPRGRSAGSFLRELRLRRAADMLTTTDDAIDHIAWEAGYRSVSALDHAFTAAYGCPPGAYRKRQRG